MLLNLTLDDATGAAVSLHETAKRYVTKASGLVGISPTRDQVRVRPQTHGGINDTRYTGPSLIVLEGECFSTAGIEDAFAEFRLIAKPMLETLDTGAALLKWREGSTGLQLQKLARLASDVDPILSESAPVVRWQAQFLSEDPRAYSQTLQTVTGAVLSAAAGGKVYPYPYPRTYNQSSGGQAAITNAGNRPTPPIFRIYGAATSPRIRLVGSNPVKEIVLSGEVAAGDYLELDVQRRTVKLNGLTNRLNFLSPADTTWFELPAGSSTVQMLANNFDASARVDVIFRGAYA